MEINYFVLVVFAMMKPKGTNYFLDKKLKALIGEFVEQAEKPVVLDDVLDYLQTFKEYQRKNRQALKHSASKGIG